MQQTAEGPRSIWFRRASPLLFEHGADDLSGYVIKDIERVARIIKGAENGKIYSTGQKVSLRK